MNGYNRVDRDRDERWRLQLWCCSCGRRASVEVGEDAQAALPYCDGCSSRPTERRLPDHIAEPSARAILVAYDCPTLTWETADPGLRAHLMAAARRVLLATDHDVEVGCRAFIDGIQATRWNSDEPWTWDNTDDDVKEAYRIRVRVALEARSAAG